MLMAALAFGPFEPLELEPICGDGVFCGAIVGVPDITEVSRADACAESDCPVEIANSEICSIAGGATDVTASVEPSKTETGVSGKTVFSVRAGFSSLLPSVDCSSPHACALLLEVV